MPPQLAAVLTWGFIFWLFRREVRQKPNVTKALWIPVLWLTINMSRPVSMWLQMFHIPVTGSLEGGTPVDAMFYFGLIGSGAYVLNQRRVTLEKVIRSNVWLTLFLGWCLISVLWSDFPLVASKRWIKVLGHPIVALVVLTEPDPKEALIRLLKRCAYVLIPLSVLFIKYYPEWGRSFSEWTGQAANSGVTLGKNALGVVCLVMFYFLVWYLFQLRQLESGRAKRNEIWLTWFFLALVVWLFKLSDSKTPLASLIPGLSLMLFVGLRWINLRFIGTYFVSCVVMLVAAELTIGVYKNTIVMLGRDTTLTDRTYLWEDLLSWEINPLIGYGFESFWLGERLDRLWELHTWRPNQSHNGYIETYLTLGLIGGCLLLFVLYSTWHKAHRHLLRDFELGRFRLGFLLAVILYNWTEASFKAMHPMWTMFYLIALDYPRPAPSPAGLELGTGLKEQNRPAHREETVAT